MIAACYHSIGRYRVSKPASVLSGDLVTDPAAANERIAVHVVARRNNVEIMLVTTTSAAISCSCAGFILLYFASDKIWLIYHFDQQQIRRQRVYGLSR